MERVWRRSGPGVGELLVRRQLRVRVGQPPRRPELGGPTPSIASGAGRDGESPVDIPVIASLNEVTAGAWTSSASALADADAPELNLYVVAADAHNLRRWNADAST